MRHAFLKMSTVPGSKAQLAAILANSGLAGNGQSLTLFRATRTDVVFDTHKSHGSHGSHQSHHSHHSSHR
jgi:hypothetical protein